MGPTFKEQTRFRKGFDRKAGAARMQALFDRLESVTRDDVIADAQKASSPLHGAFIWDADEALGHSHRLTAHYLLSNFVPVQPAEYMGRPAFEGVVPVYLSEDDDKREYVKPEVALARPDYRAQVLGQALKELRSFRRKYRTLKELSKVFEAIDEVAD